MSNTRDKILEHALTRFNEHGLEQVGVRDIARDLGLSPGNLSYHFPKKMDLVAALADQLAAANSEVFGGRATDVGQLLQIYRKALANQYAYRFLTLSVAHLREMNEDIADSYAKIEKVRRARLRDQFVGLQGPGGLHQLTDVDLSRLLGHFTLTARMWVIEHRLSFSAVPRDAATAHYLHLIADLLRPYATTDGLDMLAPYLDAPLLS